MAQANLGWEWPSKGVSHITVADDMTAGRLRYPARDTLEDRTMTQTTDAFFRPVGGAFAATEFTRGPWSPEHQHAGPPAALIGRAVEAALPDDPPMQVARITLDILRPVPIAELSVAVETTHAGRKLHLFDAELQSGGKTLIRARALAIRTADVPLPPAPDRGEPPVPPDEAVAFQFPFFTGDAGYHTGMEVRIARGEFGRGPVAAWMRMRVPLVAGEDPSPLQRVLTAADSGNGISLVLDVRRHTFVNPDLTVYLHRYPAGEWVCLDAVTTPQSHGIGLADTRLYDEQGPIGRSAQSLLIQART
jgi:hypothetical protein